MWMERKNIPKKNASGDVVQHTPDNRSSPLSDCATNRRSILRLFKIPARNVLTNMHIICQRQAGAASPAVSEVSPNPDGIYRRLYSAKQHG